MKYMEDQFINKKIDNICIEAETPATIKDYIIKWNPKSKVNSFIIAFSLLSLLFLILSISTVKRIKDFAYILIV
jgi:hypothetical protein